MASTEPEEDEYPQTETEYEGDTSVAPETEDEDIEADVLSDELEQSDEGNEEEGALGEIPGEFDTDEMEQDDEGMLDFSHLDQFKLEDEEEEEEEEEQEEAPPPKPKDPYGFDDDDDDNDELMNLILQQTADEAVDDAVLELPEEIPEEPQIDENNLANIPGIVGLNLSDSTKKFFSIEDFNAESPEHHVWLNWKQVKLHIFTYDEKSEFHPHYDIIKYYPDLQMLLGVDVNKQTGFDYYLCLSVSARNRILHPATKKQVFVDQKQKQEERWNLLSSIAPRKWRGYGSELEVDQEKAVESRPPMTITINAYRTAFGEPYSFANSNPDDPNTFADFESQDPASFPSVIASETTRAIQVMPATVSSSTQTGVVFKRNKMVQHSTQSISEENSENIMKSKGMAVFFRQTLPKLEKILQQNEMVDLLYDDYGSLKPKHGHEVIFSGKREVDPDMEPNIKDLKRFVKELLTDEPPPEETQK